MGVAMVNYKLYFDKKDKSYVAKTVDNKLQFKHRDPIEAIKGLDSSYKKKIEEYLELKLLDFFKDLKPLAVRCKIKYTRSLYVYVFVEDLSQTSGQMKTYIPKLVKKLDEMGLTLLPSLCFSDKKELDLFNKINDLAQVLNNIDVKNYVLLLDLLDERLLHLIQRPTF
ncbi:MAG: hypothetical protein ABIM30_01335 [candidate division WOR-3 bacterium]